MVGRESIRDNRVAVDFGTPSSRTRRTRTHRPTHHQERRFAPDELLQRVVIAVGARCLGASLSLDRRFIRWIDDRSPTSRRLSSARVSPEALGARLKMQRDLPGGVLRHRRWWWSDGVTTTTLEVSAGVPFVRTPTVVRTVVRRRLILPLPTRPTNTPTPTHTYARVPGDEPRREPAEQRSAARHRVGALQLGPALAREEPHQVTERVVARDRSSGDSTRAVVECFMKTLHHSAPSERSPRAGPRTSAAVGSQPAAPLAPQPQAIRDPSRAAPRSLSRVPRFRLGPPPPTALHSTNPTPCSRPHARPRR